MCCSISFPLFALPNSAIIFMLFTLQSCVKLIHIKNETWCSLVLFNQQTQSLFTNTMFFSFYVLSHMHLQICCASSNDFSVLMVLLQCLFWFIHIGFFFTLFKESAGFVSFISPMQHSHIHTVFKRYHEQDAMIEKQKIVQVTTDWWKLVKKKQDETEKNELCGYLQWRRHGRSGNWVRKIPVNQNTGNIEGNSVFRAIVVASW